MSPLIKNALLGILILDKLLHPLKAFFPITETLSGIEMFTKLEHPSNADSMIIPIPSSMVTLNISSQSLKASDDIMSILPPFFQ